MSPRRRPLPLAFALGAIAWSSIAWSNAASGQTSGPLYYSDDAALLAGAAIALPGDPGAVYYNPAGLGALNRGRVSVNGSAFGLRLRTTNNALTTIFGDTESSLDIDSVDFISTPTGVTAAFSVHPAVKLGAGFYTTERDIQSAVDDNVDDDNTCAPCAGVPVYDGMGELTQRIDLHYDSTKYHAGLALGFVLSESVRLGVGVFGIYATQDAYVQGSAEVQTSEEVATLASFILRVATSAWGIQPTLGLQWDATRAVHLALVVRAPEVMLTANTEGAATTIGATNLEPQSFVNLQISKGEAEGGLALLAPTRFSIGAALDPTPLIRVALEVELATPMEKNEQLAIERELVVNGRLGARFQVAEGVALGGGVYTDLASQPLSEALGATRINHVGATFGGSLLTPLSVGDESKPDALVLVTTLAVRYALGFGEARTLTTDAEEGGTRLGRTGVIFHEVFPYTGSAILF